MQGINIGIIIYYNKIAKFYTKLLGYISIAVRQRKFYDISRLKNVLSMWK